MKVIFALFLISSIAIVEIYSAPTDISDNNVGDIVNVNIDAEASIKNEINASIISIIIKWINLELSRIEFENGQPVPPNLPFLAENKV